MAQDPKQMEKPTKEAQPEQQPQEQQKPTTTEKVKQAASDAKEKAEEDINKQSKEEKPGRLSMEGMLHAARCSVEQFLNKNVDKKKQIPVSLLENAKGLVFLTAIKGSFGIGGTVGSGIVIKKLESGTDWSSPCAIGVAGGQWGFNIGVQKTDFMIILQTNDAIKTFSGKGELKFGGDASVSAGQLGRDASISQGAKEKGLSDAISYSLSKGLYVGVALEGQAISVRDDCNEQFYGLKMSTEEILNSPMKIENEDYQKMIQLIHDYMTTTPEDELCQHCHSKKSECQCEKGKMEGDKPQIQQQQQGQGQQKQICKHCQCTQESCKCSNPKFVDPKEISSKEQCAKCNCPKDQCQCACQREEVAK